MSFFSRELLAHAVGCRFKPCQRLLFFYLNSIHTNKKVSHPSSQSSWMHSCHTMVKSAVLPKTTSLCTSITVITLWYGGTPPCPPPHPPLPETGESNPPHLSLTRSLYRFDLKDQLCVASRLVLLFY